MTKSKYEKLLNVKNEDSFDDVMDLPSDESMDGIEDVEFVYTGDDGAGLVRFLFY